jgi:hypothetical protein
VGERLINNKTTRYSRSCALGLLSGADLTVLPFSTVVKLNLIRKSNG